MPPRFGSTALCKTARTRTARRLLHATSPWREIMKFQMPAMSPTMTEGGIAEWKKKEGERFAAGEVLLEIETDKATIDVEAQDDGIMGKIITPNGSKNVPVGKVIALLAQEGDDISNLEIPPENQDVPPPSSHPPPPLSSSPPQSSLPSSHPSQTPFVSEPLLGRVHHDRPLFPSVLRLLEENRIPDAKHIKGTGIRGMLTKGDVLAYLGKASGPNGTFKANAPTPAMYKSEAIIKKAPEENKLLDPKEIRQAILSAFLERSAKARSPPLSPVPPSFDSIISDYLPSSSDKIDRTTTSLPSKPSVGGYFDGLY